MEYALFSKLLPSFTLFHSDLPPGGGGPYPTESHYSKICYQIEEPKKDLYIYFT